LVYIEISHTHSPSFFSNIFAFWYFRNYNNGVEEDGVGLLEEDTIESSNFYNQNMEGCTKKFLVVFQSLLTTQISFG
jgi:hypothetical protein